LPTMPSRERNAVGRRPARLGLSRCRQGIKTGPLSFRIWRNGFSVIPAGRAGESVYLKPRFAHCRSAESAIPIKAAAASQFPSRCEAEAFKWSSQITRMPCRSSSLFAIVSKIVDCLIGCLILDVLPPRARQFPFCALPWDDNNTAVISDAIGFFSTI